MASELDIALEAADIYAHAVLELANQRGVAEDLFEELGSLVEYMRSDKNFADFMASAAVDDDDRHQAIAKIFTGQVSELLLNLLLVLNDHHRSAIVPLVYEKYKARLDVQLDRQDVFVTSAVALDDAQRSELKAGITAMLGRQAMIREKVEPSMLGGLIVRIGDRQYDGSLKRKLWRLREKLSERGGREILAGRHAAEE